MNNDTNFDAMRVQLRALDIGKLTIAEERYIQFRNQGVNPTAAARMAGFKHPAKAVAEMAERPEINQAIAYMREMSRAYAIQYGAIEFTKDQATALYLEAHSKAANATEEIKAIDSLVKLHGLAEPEKKSIEITRRDQLEDMSDDELLKLSGQDILLSPDDYMVKEG